MGCGARVRAVGGKAHALPKLLQLLRLLRAHRDEVVHGDALAELDKDGQHGAGGAVHHRGEGGKVCRWRTRASNGP